MRKIENQVNAIFWNCAKRTVENEKNETIKLSIRDKIVTDAMKTAYYLHDTCICVFDKMDRDFFFCPSSAGAIENVISQTTKSRLNAIFENHFNVSFKQKNYSLYLGTKEIEADKKYKMLDDMNFQELK